MTDSLDMRTGIMAEDRKSVTCIGNTGTGPDANGRFSDNQHCIVTTFVKSTVPTEAAATAAGGEESKSGPPVVLFYPMALCHSEIDHCLLFVENGERVCRVALPATPEMRAAISQSVSIGLMVAAPVLAAISPLVDLIVSYAVNDGMQNRES